jgi:hypothetical protein
MIDTIEFQNGKDVDLAVFVDKVTTSSFEIRYRVGGPAIL